MLKKEDLNHIKEYIQEEVISIGIQHLNSCIALDKLALNGMWSKEQWSRELNDTQRLCFGIFSHSEIIAMATGWIIDDELQITSIAVHPSHQQRGLGRKVLNQLLSKAHELGGDKAFLEVKSTNSAAISLYLSLDFKIIGERKKYYKDGSDALVFFCDL
ncbi:ribosomal protein S18-alanine N-acetyltransferase [Prochlorococcus sp. MIT 1223]|uniref:ribosomal protein S18-alanine N-acetyltransferase n=1 Tax=Prochlorococcus sp. MIT 1223 TaxID=3096217 RepID=UPI002A750CB2|nr:ribosomal protein S18-alanine N-acetyltransferase [Prochlorococcus sp. MIT 1223]